MDLDEWVKAWQKWKFLIHALWDSSSKIWNPAWIGRSCGAVGRALASNTRDQLNESQNQLDFFDYIIYLTTENNEEKMGRKEKVANYGLFFKSPVKFAAGPFTEKSDLLAPILEPSAQKHLQETWKPCFYGKLGTWFLRL